MTAFAADALMPRVDADAVTQIPDVTGRREYIVDIAVAAYFTDVRRISVLRAGAVLKKAGITVPGCRQRFFIRMSIVSGTEILGKSIRRTRRILYIF